MIWQNTCQDIRYEEIIHAADKQKIAEEYMNFVINSQ